VQLGSKVTATDVEKVKGLLQGMLEQDETVRMLVRGSHTDVRGIDIHAITDHRVINLALKRDDVEPVAWDLEDCEAIDEVRTVAVRLRKWNGAVVNIGYLLSRSQDEKAFVATLEETLQAQPNRDVKAKAIAACEVRVVGFKFPDETGRMAARRLNPFLEPEESVLYVGSFVTARGIRGDSLALTNRRMLVFAYKDFGEAPTTSNRYDNLAAFSCTKSQFAITDHIGNQVVLGRLRHDRQDLETVVGILSECITNRATSTSESSPSQAQAPIDGAMCDVRLNGAGSRPIPVIKIVRRQLNLGLREARDLVESSPVILIRGVPSRQGLEIQRALETAGASVTLTPSDESMAQEEATKKSAEGLSMEREAFPVVVEEGEVSPAHSVVSAGGLPTELPDPLPDGFQLGDFGTVLDHPPGAAGAFGRVYRVRRSFDDRILAGKLYLRGTSSDYGELADEGIRREVEALESLSHPNVVRVFSPIPVTSTGEWMILSEWLDGKDLVPYTSGSEPNSGETIFDLGSQLLAALEYLESIQVVHRDLKPANVMLTSDRQLKIIDFNLAREVGQVTAIAGTQLYMPPDFMSLAHSTDHFVDRYAAGVMLYELVTQLHPYYAYFTSQTPVLTNSRPMSPERLRADVSPDLSAFLLQSVSALDAHRFPSAKEMRTRWMSLEQSVKGLV
jgi:ribosomal protein L7/L12/tRNA A-37 threonylcarbamoyl transferase component Bud32